MNRRLLALSLTALSLVAACGTTVPLTTQQQAGQAPVAGGLGQVEGVVPGTEVPTVGGGVVPGTNGSAPGKVVRPGTSVGGSSPQSGPSAPGAVQGATAPGQPAAAVPPKGPGWDEKTVYVGVLTQKDTAAAFSSVGYDGINPGDTEAQAKAIVDAINKRGGVLGRRMVLDFVDVPTIGSATNPDQTASEVCTHYTQDRRVIAVVNIVATLDVDSFRACFAKAKIVLWDAADVPVDTAIAKGFAPYFSSGMAPAWDAVAPLLVDRLQAQGWFGGWDAVQAKPAAGKKPKIGVLVLENPLGKRIAAIIKSALAKRGYTDVVQFEYTYPGNNIQPAISYFNGNGVTHVISSDIELVTFQINAQNQRYTPRYGINTYNVPFHNLEGVGSCGPAGRRGRHRLGPGLGRQRPERPGRPRPRPRGLQQGHGDGPATGPARQGLHPQPVRRARVRRAGRSEGQRLHGRGAGARLRRGVPDLQLRRELRQRPQPDAALRPGRGTRHRLERRLHLLPLPRRDEPRLLSIEDQGRTIRTDRCTDRRACR